MILAECAAGLDASVVLFALPVNLILLLRLAATEKGGWRRCAVVHPADLQDRDGAILGMATLFATFSFFQNLFADSGYQWPEFTPRWPKFATSESQDS
jgi:hypothetical protein